MLSPEQISAPQIAKALGIHRNSAHDILQRLCQSCRATRIPAPAKCLVFYVAGPIAADAEEVPMTTVSRAILSRPLLATVWGAA